MNYFLRYPIYFICFLLIACGKSAKTSYQGYIVGENIYLASPNSGILQHLAVKRGDYVKKDQLLFELDPNPQAFALKQSKNNLNKAMHLLYDLKKPRREEEINAIKAQIDQVDAQLELAKIRVNRSRQLFQKNAMDKDSLDAAIANLTLQEKLKAQYLANLNLAKQGSREEQIKAQQQQLAVSIEKFNETKWQVDQKKGTAPAHGLIFDTYYREGEFVPAQQPVLSLLTPANVHIEFFVPVNALSSLKVGQKITFSCFGCKNSTEAVINYISPEAQYAPPLVYTRENSDKLVFRIKAALRKFNEYKPGQPVSVFLP